MATIDDILHARDAAMNEIDLQILSASRKRTAENDERMTQIISDLADQKAAIADQAVIDIGNSDDAATALANLDRIIGQLRDTAQNMRSATDFMDNISRFLGFAAEAKTELSKRA